jgi:hypothetical protein
VDKGKGGAQFTEMDGRRLAVDMLVEMRDLGSDALIIDDANDYRDGPQNDLLAGFLRAAHEHPAVEAGFLQVLTDVLGSAVEGGGAIEHYEALAGGVLKD